MALNLTIPPAAMQQMQAQPQSSLEDQLTDRASQAPPAPHSSSPPSAKGPILAALLGGAADVGTTQYNLAQPFGREQNPLLPKGRVANGIALGGSYIANALASKYLNDHGHPTIAKILGYGGGIDGGISAAHNMAHANDWKQSYRQVGPDSFIAK